MQKTETLPIIFLLSSLSLCELVNSQCKIMEQQAKLNECIVELLKYTLESHINGTLDTDLALTSGFCSHLLLTQDPSRRTGTFFPPSSSHYIQIKFIFSWVNVQEII